MKQHILLIDHNKNELLFFLDALKQVPHEDGFKCTYANSSVQAIEMLKYLVPDIIFVDNSDPETNGMQTIRQIRKDPRLKNTRTFLYSSAISENAFWNARQSGATGCIKKCDSVEKLTDELRSIFISGVAPSFTLSVPNNELQSSHT